MRAPRHALQSHWYLLPMLVVLAVIGIGFAVDARRTAADVAISPATFPAPAYGPRNFAAALADADGRIALGREQTLRMPDEWGAKEILARGLMARANLTGDYAAWAEARKLLDEGMALAPKGSGPVVAHATLALSTHRLAALADDLAVLKGAAIPPDAAQQSGLAGLSGDIAFYRGDMAAAAREYRRGAGWHSGPVIDYRLAVLAMAEARFDDADAAIARSIAADRATPPQALAQAAMRLGAHAMAQGDWKRGEQYFARADAIFPGHWLTAAHRAQAEALTGDPAKAAAQMAATAQASNSAEAMDAAAMLYRHLGDRANSRRWAGRAASLWAERLRLFPEAAYGHALEHELAFGTPVRALDLAQRNLALRPYGESRLLLANALLMNNRPQAALTEIARAEASGWRSAPLYALKAEAAALAAKPALAQQARDQAEAINPRIFDPRISLVWFSHG